MPSAKIFTFRKGRILSDLTYTGEGILEYFLLIVFEGALAGPG